MKQTRLLIALIAAIILIVAVAGCAGGGASVTDPDKSLKEAQALVAKAKAEAETRNGTPAERKEVIKRYLEGDATKPGAARLGAIGTYNAVATQYKDKPQGAQAQYELGRFYETFKGYRNYQLSYTQYTTLLNRFDKSREELASRGYLPNEIDHVLALVQDAKVGQKKMGEAQDRVNSRHKLLGIINVYAIMDFLVKMTGSIPGFSYWFAIIIVTLVVKLAITPLTKAQFKSMKEMQKISPLIKEIQEKYKGDQQVIGQKTMDLYKEHGINPFASCLPIIIQMPVLLLLFRMVSLYQFQFAKGHFLWIGSSLSHTKDFVLPFGAGGTVWLTARNLSEPDLILVVLYVISMYISTKLSNVDPTQAEQQKMMSIMMPVMFAFIFASYPAAFLLYWLVFNIIQTVQQYLILNKGNEMVPATGPAPAPEEPKTDQPQRPRRRRRR